MKSSTAGIQFGYSVELSAMGKKIRKLFRQFFKLLFNEIHQGYHQNIHLKKLAQSYYWNLNDKFCENEKYLFR